MQRLDCNLEFLLRMENDGHGHIGWVAECLGYDIVVQAKSLSLLRERVIRILVCQAELDVRRGIEPFSGIAKGTRDNWAVFETGYPIELQLPPLEKYFPLPAPLSFRLPSSEELRTETVHS